MWIAKAIDALSAREIEEWVAIQEILAKEERDFPLSQTLTWASAAEKLGTKSYLIMNAEEKVGGIVHAETSGAEGPVTVECTNGPLLNWSDAQTAPRHFATFAMAVSKLGPSVGSIRLSPRWSEEDQEKNLACLPVEPSDLLLAATIHVEVQKSESEQRAKATARLRRSLSLAEQAGVRSSWSLVDEIRLRRFVGQMLVFGQEKGFYVPDLDWFCGLISNERFMGLEKLRFFLAGARLFNGRNEILLESEALVCLTQRRAHYLFGYERREAGVRSAISAAAVTHFRALQEISSRGILYYDLNGFSDPKDPEHPYAGVSVFKSQFGGREIRYVCPEFEIETGIG